MPRLLSLTVTLVNINEPVAVAAIDSRVIALNVDLLLANELLLITTVPVPPPIILASSTPITTVCSVTAWLKQLSNDLIINFSDSSDKGKFWRRLMNLFDMIADVCQGRSFYRNSYHCNIMSQEHIERFANNIKNAIE